MSHYHARDGATPAKTGCAGCLFGFILSMALSLGVLALGFTFLPVNTITLVTLLCGVAFYLTAKISLRRRPRLPVALLTGQLLLLNFGWTAFFIWDTPRFCTRSVTGDPIPPGVTIRRTLYDESPDGGRAWVNLSTTPDSVREIIARHNLQRDDSYHLSASFGPGWALRVNSDSFTHYGPTGDRNPHGATRIWVNASSNEVVGTHGQH